MGKVISFYNRSRYDFLFSEIYGFNRKPTAEENFLFIGAVLFTVVFPLGFSYGVFGEFALAVVTGSSLIGLAFGVINNKYSPYKVENYFERLLLPDGETKTINNRPRRAA